MMDIGSAWRMIRSLALLMFVVWASTAGADYNAGKRARGEGKPAEAMAQWRAAADAGDRRAMLELGRLYFKGLGAPQDYVLAHMWFNLAASRGELDALKERDALAAQMTPQQLAAAQERARTWRPGGGRVAGPEPAAAEQPTEASPPLHAIREAQELLAALGYEPGRADGLWGARSARAYAAFLRDAGLPPGDALTPEGLRAMRAAAKPQRARTETSSTASTKKRKPAAPRPDALHRAVLAGDIDGLKSALKARVDVNARDGHGWTALMHATNKGYALLVPPLLKAGAKPNLRAADGATALFIATLHGHSEIFAQLVRKGADVTIPGPKGKLPLEVARELKHLSIIALPEVVALQQAEARKKQEAAERKMRDEVLEREREESDALGRAQTSNTPSAYKDFLASWCPGSKLCARVHLLLDESIEKALVGGTFGGVISTDEEVRYEFLPSGKLSAVIRPSSWTSSLGSGTWNVDDGKVRMRIEWSDATSNSTADYNDELLTVHQHITRRGLTAILGGKVRNNTFTASKISR